MKQLLLTGFILSAAALPAMAQGGYQDDVYSSAPVANSSSSSGNRSYNDDNYRNDNGNYNDRYGNDGTYANDYDYIDYEDDYYYATRFRRFNNPFYNVNYWSGFWSPWSYDPFWGSPWYGGYAGYGYGYGSPGGVYISINIGGPYWSSGWGYNNWYGYSPFYSYWSRPYYSGWGFGSGYNHGYRSGYWDGYYAGMYGAGYGNSYAYRRVNYAPRATVGGINGVGFRNTNPQYRPAVSESTLTGNRENRNNRAIISNPPTGGRMNNEGINRPDRNRISEGNINRNLNNGQRQPGNVRDRAVNDRNPDFRNGSVSDRPVQESTVPSNTTRPRGGFFGNSDSRVETPQQPDRSNSDFSRDRVLDRSNQQMQPQQAEPPRRTFGEQPARGFDGPQMSAPPQRSFERPSRSFDRPQMSAPPQGSFERPSRSFERPQMSAPSRSFDRPQMSAPSRGLDGSGGGFRRR